MSPHKRIIRQIELECEELRRTMSVSCSGLPISKIIDKDIVALNTDITHLETRVVSLQRMIDDLASRVSNA